MQCQVCGERSRVNYGDGYLILCEKCSHTHEGKALLNKERTFQGSSIKGEIENGLDMNPFVIGILVTVLGLVISLILVEVTKISIFVWSIFIFFGIIAASVAFILKELKNIQSRINKNF